MKKLAILIFLILISINSFAVVDRVIDAEIPINDDFVDFEQDFDILLMSIMQIVLLSIGAVSGTVIVLIGIYAIATGIKLF